MPWHAFRLWMVGLATLGLGACATTPAPITKLVDGRQITTRSINPDAYEHVSRALLYEEQEQWKKAAEEIRSALVFDHDSPELHAQLAELLLRLGDIEGAADEARDSLKIGRTASGLLAEAHVRRAKGDVAGAVASLRKATNEVEFQASDDDAEEVYLELADAELRVLDVPSAQGTLEILTRAEPASGMGRMRLAAIYWAEGDMPKAEAQLRAALAEEPNQIEALAALAWICAAEGNTAKARQAFADALDRSENALDIAAAYARFLVGIGATKAAEQLADDFSVPPGSLDADTIAGRIELERSAGRLDRALALLEQAQGQGIPEDDKNRFSFTRAALLKEQGKTDAAIAAVLAVAKTSPLYFEARLRAAELLREAGRYSEATRTVEEALPLAAGDRVSVEIEAAVSLALIDEKRGDPATGVDRLVKMLVRQPDDKRSTLTLAAIEERRGNWRRGLDLVAHYLAKNPGSVEALNFWGFVAADHGFDLDLAGKRLQVANALDPGSGGLIDSLAWVRFRSKDLDKAAMFIEQAARLEPKDPEIRWHLGEIYAERKETARAVAAFRRGLGLSPDERVQRKLQDSLARLSGGRISGK